MSDYSIRRSFKQPFAEVLAKLPAALKTEGFGVLTEIDVKATMKEKLDVTLRPYRILGACNPPLAYRALQTETEIGVMLPCNVIVYETESGDTVVAAIDPERTMAAVGSPALAPLAGEVSQKLRRVLASL